MEHVMPSLGKQNILGILIDTVDYQQATDFICQAARHKRGVAVSALAVHGLMTGVLDREQQFRLNHFDLLVPDGQPVRWALNWFYGAELADRVYGPNLTLKVCARAEKERLPVYYYGSTPVVLAALRKSLQDKFPDLIIAGMEPSKFRRLTLLEKEELATRVRSSAASLLFVGLGCPRQEIFAYEFRAALSIPIIAVGAAFPFLARLSPQAPQWMQDVGLEWFFRLCCEPRRLWKRYLYLNCAYIFLAVLQVLRIRRFSVEGKLPARELLYG